jgi:hypothetical protein
LYESRKEARGIRTLCLRFGGAVAEKSGDCERGRVLHVSTTIVVN